MRLTGAQIAAGILILSAGAAVVVLPGRVFGPERVTAPLALPATQPAAVQAQPVKAPVKHRVVVTTPVHIARVVTHVSAPPSKPTTVVHRTVAPRQVVKQISKPKPQQPQPATTTTTSTTPPPAPPPTTTTTPTTTTPTSAATGPTGVTAAQPPSTTAVTSPLVDKSSHHGKGKAQAKGHDKPAPAPPAPPAPPATQDAPVQPDHQNGQGDQGHHGDDHGNGHGNDQSPRGNGHHR